MNVRPVNPEIREIRPHLLNIRMTGKKTLVVLLFIALGLPGASWATNGYFQHGIGVKEQSLGGAAIAYPQSTLSIATNPASATAIGKRFDIGLNWFNPERSADNNDGTGYHESGSTDFLIPLSGYSHPLTKKITLAFVAYANGGMQTDWPKKFYGETNTSSELKQMVFAPSVAFNLTPEHSLGLSVNYIRQSFEARGLQNFALATPSGTTDYLTDVGEDISTGWGLRIGYSGQLSPFLRVGAFWQPRTHMGKFDAYRELFSHRGEFDVPETFGAGLAIEFSENFHLAADLVKISYSDVPSLANRNTFGSELLGTNNGSGFGWKDITVVKLGLAYEYSPALTLRIGWNHGDTPLRSSETAMNVLSPATITDHLTLGFSWAWSDRAELSMTYWHGFQEELEGDETAANGGDAANLKMSQDNIGIACSWVFD